ncbi:polyamine-transporting ATPase [Mesorhizobium sp. L-8-10]|uniref:ABC transporter ATP-binding protein n=1 Tax=Mesorhizobium sp. L-8-10 TaxID=2744523 RepID=UPI001925F982|nr:ABC transporter ATP-binding protein [Mesorhizobium sp. L-8-10]BCH29894.1 polyamine-transporting ATPase [Mesorhizobium sp. L-8-10]
MSEPNIVADQNAIRRSGRLVLDNVCKDYGDFVAVDDVNFALAPGEFLTLLGPSGSGKTTTLMMVAGFEDPTRGTIKVGERDMVSLSPKERNFGVVFQSYALFPHMTARQNVEFPLRMRKQSADARRKAALEMLETVGLASFANRMPRELSGGQQQRVALARALVFKPDALLLDEPLGALDKQLREQMQYEIKDLQKKLGVSVLFVTHDQEEAMTMSDRIAVMDKGRIVQMGTPQDVYHHPATEFVANFLGETNLIPCVVEDASNEQVTVKLDNGQRCCALPPRIGVPPSTGERAKLSIRPERVRILSGDERVDTTFKGIAQTQSFLGRHFRSVVSAMDQQIAIITSDLDRASMAQAGREISIGWMKQDAQVLART